MTIEDSDDVTATCHLYSFTMESVLMGAVILSGMATNTVACAVLWQERVLTAPVFLLQAALIADIAVLWMLFISESVPSLAYALPVLDECSVVCYYIHAITKPLLFLAQSCSLLFTLWAIMNRYVILCKPVVSTKYSDFKCARLQAVATIVVSLLFALPLTMDSAIGNPVHHDTIMKSKQEPLVANKYYYDIYINGVLFLLFLVLPLLAVLYCCIKLARVMQSAKQLRRLLEPGFKMENMDITQVMLAMGVTLFICYLPKTALTVVQIIDSEMRHYDCGELQYFLNAFSNLFISINSASKLVILHMFAKRFRASLHRNFGKPEKRAVFRNRAAIYKCGDKSEMTLMSNLECTGAEEELIFKEDS